MTDRELRRLAKQLRAGATGYYLLTRAVRETAVGDEAQVDRALERMGMLQRELDELATEFEHHPPQWLREWLPKRRAGSVR